MTEPTSPRAGLPRASSAHAQLMRDLHQTMWRERPAMGLWRHRVDAWVRAGILHSRTERSAREMTQLRMFGWSRQQGHEPGTGGHRPLTLSSHGLTSAPPAFPREVQHLNLNYNRLRGLRCTLPTRLESLNVHHNQLQALPAALPRGLLALNASHNLLRGLPSHLPVSIQSLILDHNHLSQLPSRLPDDLRDLEVSHNQLQTLPSALPRGLRSLQASANALTRFPTPLPPGLLNLDLSNNRITELSSSDIDAIAGMDRRARVDLRGNPLSPQTVMRLAWLRSEARDEGPELLYPGIQSAYQTQWQRWIDEPLAMVPQRVRAVTRLNEWLQDNTHNLEARQPLTPMDLSRLRLERLPPLPDGVTHLNLDQNHLERLPEHLPHSLTHLSANNNLLLSLPPTLPRNLQHLELTFNGLEVLPNQLPAHLRELWVQGNQLSHLPEHLPDGLVDLRAQGNRLTHLPEHLPESLRRIEVSHNQLSRLPERLPSSLQWLQADCNRLTELTQHHLHPPLGGHRVISVTHNPLSWQTILYLEAMRADMSPSGAEVQYTRHPLHPLFDNVQADDLLDHAHGEQDAAARQPLGMQPDHGDGQPLPPLEHARRRADRALAALPAQVRAEVERLRRNTEAAGHPVDVEQLLILAMTLNNVMGEPPITQLHRGATTQVDLGRAAAAWVLPPSADMAPSRQAPTDPSLAAGPAMDTETTFRQWESFGNEPGATAFAQFLHRLRETINVNDPAFVRNVVQWLDQLARHPELRRDTFALSIGATESCEDRISLTFNAMRKLSMASDVAQGQYDQRLPDLITLARGVFRLEQLEGIARETTAALIRTHGAQAVDEIEVYLGYQVMLREPLALPVDTANMAFFRCSRLTQDDLDRAQARVLAAEQQEFSNYLATDFAPWQEVMQRLAPALHEQAQDTLIDAMGDEFSRRLIDRLGQLGLQGDADAERNLGPVVQAEIAREINGRLTRDFLASQGLLDLLNPDPTYAPDAASPNRSSGRPSS